MSLQVRVRHALGERLVELPDRTADAPAVVGRGAGCDIAVPAVAAAQRHCALYRQDGEWVLSDLGTLAGTSLNGRRLGEPAVLRAGDRVVIGSGPAAPVLEIDPAGIVLPGRDEGGQPDLPPPPLEETEDSPFLTEEAGQETSGPNSADRVAWMAAPLGGAVPVAPMTRQPPPRTISMPLVVCVAIAVGAIGVAVWVLVSPRAPKVVTEEPPPARPRTTAPAPGPSVRAVVGNVNPPPRAGEPRGVAEMPRSAPPPEPIVAVAPPPPIPAPRPAATTRPAAPVLRPATVVTTRPTADDPAWGEIAALHAARRTPAVVIFRLADYKRTQPGKHDTEADQWTDAEVDALWWERVAQLFRIRDRLTVDIAKTRRDLWDETNPDFKKKSLDALKAMEKELARTGELLKVTMDYPGDQPPDPTNPAQLAELSKARNRAKFAAWKKVTLGYILNNKGRVAWEADG